MKKKRGIKSLYLSLSLSFIMIMIFVVVGILLYGAIKGGLSMAFAETVIGRLMGDSILEKTLEALKSALWYGIIIGLALVLIVTSHIIRPIRKLTEATKKIASGNFNTTVDINRNDEIGELADNFNIMVKELNSIEYLRKDFVSNVSHEFKTPIASIQGFAKLLEKDNLSKEDRQEYINIILEETGRLSNLSNNMIKLTNFENQEIVTNKKEYRIDEQLRKAVIMLEEKINEKKIKVTLDSKEISIIEDADLIMEIWINLLNNAIKYSNENGNIEIKVEEQEEFIQVDIKDDGIGIPKDKQERIFEKFYQAEKSHAYEGCGLGLAIVKRIIDLTNGKIEVESEEAKGTKFTVYVRKNFA